jgi:hypothetical protein
MQSTAAEWWTPVTASAKTGQLSGKSLTVFLSYPRISFVFILLFFASAIAGQAIMQKNQKIKADFKLR